ncbi:ankyrin repeat protein [Megavirus chiliensis]|nr:putative ankyrin repeat protein [Megavirus chiliensis]AEQ32644.1 ankyrin repeat protein [Megavirus chiliensis]
MIISYYMILNKQNQYFGRKYCPGLNFIDQNIAENKWLFFTEIKTIETYIENDGYYFYEVFLPTMNPALTTIKNSKGLIYGANMIILSEPMKLSKVDTWKYILSIGITITPYIINKCQNKGYLEVLDYFIDNNYYPSPRGLPKYQYLIFDACKEGFLDVIKADTKYSSLLTYIDMACVAADYGHYHIVKYIFEYKIAPPFEKNIELIYDINKIALYACKNGHLSIVKYLVKLGTNVRFSNDTMIYVSYNCLKFNVLKYLLDLDNTIIKIITKIDYNNYFKLYLADEYSLDLNYSFHHYDKLYPDNLPEDRVYFNTTIKNSDFTSQIIIQSYKILYKPFSIRRCFLNYEKYNYLDEENPFKIYFNYFGISDDKIYCQKIENHHRNLKIIFGSNDF